MTAEKTICILRISSRIKGRTRKMARDDYDKIVSLILAYLYAKLKGKTDERPEVYLQPMTKDFPISEEYFYFVLDEMVKKNMITGIKFTRVWGGEIINISGTGSAQITSEGIHALKEDKPIRKALEWFRDNAIALPGLVATICEILNYQEIIG